MRSLVRRSTAAVPGKRGDARPPRAVLMLLVCVAALAGSAIAVAGSAHFIRSATSVTRSGDSLVANFKVAGLGDENQVRVVLSADAQCVNGGSNKPKAGNKQSFDAQGNFPVQNGQAEGTLTLTATFQPSCSPPMTVSYSNVRLEAYDTNGTLNDTSDDVLVASFSVSGTF